MSFQYWVLSLYILHVKIIRFHFFFYHWLDTRIVTLILFTCLRFPPSFISCFKPLTNLCPLTPFPFRYLLVDRTRLLTYHSIIYSITHFPSFLFRVNPVNPSVTQVKIDVTLTRHFKVRSGQILPTLTVVTF